MLHGKRHHDRSRMFSLLMFTTAVARMVVWLALIVITLVGVTAVVHMFQQVLWVALLSLYANFATDMSTAAGSWAALTAGHAHADAEHTRAVITGSAELLEADIARLAALRPGPEAQQLAAQIRARLAGNA